MAVDTGITFEERQIQSLYFIKKMGIPLKELNLDGLEKEIIKFLAKPQCLSLGTVNPDGSPHQTIVDYVSDGLEIYIATEGGEKIINLDLSNKVSITIGYTDGTAPSEYGLTMEGTAEVYQAPHPKFLAGMLKLKNFLMEWSKPVQPLENPIKRVIAARVIKITPHKALYMNLPEGIPFMRWEKGK